MKVPKDFILDYETLGNAPEGATVDLACIVFDFDVHNPPTFADLVYNGTRSKFCLPSQKSFGPYPRTFDKSTMEWWAKQSAEAKAGLMAGPCDVQIDEGLNHILNFIKDKGCDPWKTRGWARGMSFDFSILVSQIRQVFKTRETFEIEPCKFWNQRDVRTFIEATLMQDGMTECPLPKGTLNGFIAHNSVHDCAKDVLMMIYAVRYALGLEDVPVGDDADPLSLPKGRK